MTSPHGFEPKNQTLLIEVAFAGIVAFWGISFVLSKNALDVIGPFAYNTLRMSLGTIALALLVGRNWVSVNRSYMWPSIVTGFTLFLAYASYTYGQQLTTATKAGFLSGTNVVFVAVLSVVLLHRVPSMATIVGVILSFSGLTLLSIEGSIKDMSFVAGDLWVVLGSVLWALYIISLARYSPHLGINIYATLHIFIATLLNGVCWFLFEPLVMPTSSTVWIAVVSTGVIIIGLGTSIQTWITRMISPTRVALISALEPVFAALAGWWIGEAITLRGIIGGALIVTGMLVAELRHFSKRKTYAMTKIIQTQRLKLIPLTLEQLQLFLTDLPQLEDDLGLPIDSDNTNETVLRAINIKISKMAHLDPAQHPWLTYWLIVIADKSLGAGMAGFKGIIDQNGETEIGYGISPIARGNGYMTEAVQALIAWAFDHEQCRAVVALDVLRSNIASQRVLEKVGMHVYQETADTLAWRIDKTAK